MEAQESSAEDSRARIRRGFEGEELLELKRRWKKDVGRL